MSDRARFSADWLQLREGADARARNRDLASALSAWFALRPSLHVVDLGCGTGANLRATAPLLPPLQHWRLIDHDASLLDAARTALRRWADESETAPDGSLRLRKGGASLTVAFETRDLARDMDGIFAQHVDLVTAAALFDLVSAVFLKTLVRKLAAHRAALYAVLSYNGLQRWTPHRPADNQMTAAFNRHQMTDKGFGPAAGPMAASELSDQLKLAGYSVQEGDSPWRLGVNDRMLVDELLRGQAMAILEINGAEAKTVEAWVKTTRNGAEIGHTDVVAFPPAGAARSEDVGAIEDAD